MSILKEAIRTKINESIVIEPTFSDIPKDKMVGYLVKKTFAFTNQIHAFHILTKNAQEHETLGKLYMNMTYAIDGIAEEYLAMGGECSGEFQSVTYYDYSFNLLREVIGDFYELVNEVISYLDKPTTESIKKKVIVLQDAIHKAEYQLNLT